MDKKIENHEYNLRQFIHTATRWSLESIYNTKTPQRPFSMLTDFIIIANVYFDDFKNQLRLEIDKSENGKAFETDIKDRFLLGIKDYNIWYDKNKLDVEKLWGNENLYSMMFDVMLSTEREINKYFSPQQYQTDKAEGVNPYPEIFKDFYSFKLFEHLYNNYKESNNLLADFSFTYRKMKADGYIKTHYRPEMFKDWLSKETYNIVLDAGLKTIDRCTTKAKEINYATSKELVNKSVS